MSEKFTTARITKAGEKFEILVKPEKALDYKLGKTIGISQILAIEEIYSDASKGTRASAEKLQKNFGTVEISKIAEVVLKQGELQLTTDQRRHMIEEKRRQVISFINRNCLDPRTGTPHPVTRIEQALTQIKYSLDPFKGTEEQVKDIIEELKKILPLKMEHMRLTVTILADHAAKAYGSLKSFGTVANEAWQSDGSLIAVLEMPAGMYEPFVERLGKLTQGTVQTKILK